MARDRQRAKQRQAQRRAERLAERQSAGGDGRTHGSEPAGAGGPESREDVERDEALTGGDLHELADLEVGAPPEDLGRSDAVLRHEQAPPPDFEIDDAELADEAEETVAAGPRGVRGGRERAEHRERGRLIAFLVAVWAELQRVQWPDRRQLTQLTGVVLFFVLVVGAYLGGLDEVFSQLISHIL
jgi:preprotein translocase subunit SecE